MTPPLSGPILLYDGECGLCGAAVRFVLRHDRRGVFHFAGLDTVIGRNLRMQSGVSPEVDSLVVIDEGVGYIRSDAILAILRHLGGRWHLLRMGGLLPRRWRDALYEGVARRRRRWSARWGMSCVVPTPAQRARFL